MNDRHSTVREGPSIDPYAALPYCIEWRPDLTCGWVIIKRMAENPGDLKAYVKAHITAAWAAGGQFRCVTQHVISAFGLGAENFPSQQ